MANSFETPRAVHRIFQATMLECIAVSFSRGSSWPRTHTHSSCHVSCILGVFFTTEPPGKPILYIIAYICQSQSPNYPLPTSLLTICLFSPSVTLFLFHKEVHLCHFFVSVFSVAQGVAYFAHLRMCWSILKISVRTSWLIMLFRSTISFMISC